MVLSQDMVRGANAEVSVREIFAGERCGGHARNACVGSALIVQMRSTANAVFPVRYLWVKNSQSPSLTCTSDNWQ